MWNSIATTIERSVPSPSRQLADLTREEVCIEDLAMEFDGYTIVALADFHHRPSMGDLRWLRHAVDIANGAMPDVVALLGDYGSSFKHAPLLSQRWYRDSMTAMTPELCRLRARDEIIGLLGNHD